MTSVESNPVGKTTLPSEIINGSGVGGADTPTSVASDAEGVKKKEKKDKPKAKPAPTATSTIQNLSKADPFADDELSVSTSSRARELDAGTKSEYDYVHIRIQQRNGRKTLTTVQGLPAEFDPKKLMKAFKKEFACNGSIVEDDEYGQVVQLQGDQRTNVSEFLVDAEIVEKGKIKIHGF